MDLSLIILILDICIFFILGIALIKGFVKGFKKSLIQFIASMVGAVLLLIFLDPICSLLINTELPLHLLGQEDMSMKEFILSSFKSLNGGAPVEEGTALAEFADGMMIMSLRITVLYTGLMINGFVSLILRFIINLFVGKSRNEDGTPKKKVFVLRFGGMAINGIRCLFFMGLFLLPFYGIVSVGTIVQEELNYVANTEEEKNTKDYLFEIITAVESSYVKKGINYSNKIFGKQIDTAFLGYLTRIKTQYGTLDWVQEVDLFKLVVNYLEADQKSGDEDFDYMTFISENRDIIYSFLEKSEIIPVIMPPLLEMISDEDYQKIGLSRDEVINIDWDQETETLAKVFDAVLSLIDITGTDYEQFTSWFETEEAIDAFSEVGKELQNSQLFKLGLSLIEDKLKEQLFSDPKYADLANLLDFKKLSEGDLENDFRRIGLVVQALNKMHFFDGNMAADGENLSAIIINVFQLSIVKGNETAICEELFEVTGINEMLQELGVTINFSDVNWSNETTAIADIVRNFMELNMKIDEFDQDALFTLADEQNRDKLVVFMNSLFDSDLLSQVIVHLLDNAFKSAQIEEFLDPSFAGYLDGTNDVSNLKNDVEILVDLLVLMTDEHGNLVSLNFENASSSDLDLIFDILELANNSTIFNLNAVIGYLDDMLETTGFVDGSNQPITVSTTSLTKEQWETELQVLKTIIEMMIDLDDLTNADLTTMEETMATLLDAIQHSLLLQDLEVILLQNLIDNLGYQFDISTLDLSNVVWADEMAVLVSLLNDYNQVSSDLAAADNVENLMLTASTSVIATAIIGQTINEQLALLYPQLTSGLIPDVYDFTNSNTLSESSSKIAAIIEFGEALKNLVDAINNDTVIDDDIDEFVDKYSALSMNEVGTRPDLIDDLMSGVISYAVGGSVSLTAEQMALISYQSEATIIGDSLKVVYDNSSTNSEKIEAINDLRSTVLGNIIADIIA